MLSVHAHTHMYAYTGKCDSKAEDVLALGLVS